MTALIVGNLTQNFARQVGYLTIGETLDSGLKTLKLKDFVPIQYESATNKIFDSTSVFATESFCMSFIDTETFKCGFVVRRVFSFVIINKCYQEPFADDVFLERAISLASYTSYKEQKYRTSAF